MQTASLDYHLPPELIAQRPAAERAGSRLLVVRAGSHAPETEGPFGQTFFDQLRPDDLVVANDTRVLHARIPVLRPGGGRAELLLLEPAPEASRQWRALARPGKRLRPGMDVACQNGDASVRIVEQAEEGEWIVELPVPTGDAANWLQEHGEVPLPPYITPNGQPPDRYQTVYSEPAGSVAAPTAGLHFDEEGWERLAREWETVRLTLHVGAGTFRPVRVDDLADHDMHAERYEVPPSTDAAVRTALAAGRRVVAIGTTTTRVLESVYGEAAMPLRGSTSVFITPGYRFGCVGGLLTNFHLPRSTLLALVMALAGEGTALAAYEHAVAHRFRFFSFGDAMFIHGAVE